MSYVTRLSLRGLSEEERRKVAEALEYCRTHDKAGGFSYTLTGDAAYITSGTREQAAKRGSYFHKRFKVFYNIIQER
jgi:Na+/phosphate symporter